MRSDVSSREKNPLREGLIPRKTPSAATVVLFGASGDLTRRKLLPAISHLAESGLLPPKLAVVGVARRAKTDESFREEMMAGGAPISPSIAEALHYHELDFDDAAAYPALGKRLDGIERELGLPGNRLFYLATAPAYFATIAKRLAGAGLAKPPEGSGRWVRAVVEKPFGKDLASARRLNADLLSVLDEEQIYRIDHYLGKETVQNLLAFRFSNEIFEPLWNQKYVSHVQITVAETVGVEGRGGYYDKAGVVRDMVQNHMLQVLSLVAMEPPAAVDADAIRNEKVKVLQSIRKLDAERAATHAVHGQYAAGTVLGKAVPGYLEEEGVPGDSRTPTYVALRLEIDNWRWAGVPFLLRSGKRLPRRATEIAIEFRRPPLQLFGGPSECRVSPNALIVNVQPDEGISLRFGAKLPGPDIQIQQVKMDFRYGSSFGVPSPEAYERLILDALAGDSTLFTRRDEVEAAWALIDPLIARWESGSDRPHAYPAGSWGPEEAERLFDGTGGSWRRI
jgi:glucose-6-phosphate 1-dehydrogenase